MRRWLYQRFFRDLVKEEISLTLIRWRAAGNLTTDHEREKHPGVDPGTPWDDPDGSPNASRRTEVMKAHPRYDESVSWGNLNLAILIARRHMLAAWKPERGCVCVAGEQKCLWHIDWEELNRLEGVKGADVSF